jgi:hypothetical protein
MVHQRGSPALSLQGGSSMHLNGYYFSTDVPPYKSVISRRSYVRRACTDDIKKSERKKANKNCFVYVPKAAKGL